MSTMRIEISEDMVRDIARDRRGGVTWAWLSRQYGIQPQSLKRAFLRKSAEMYGPEETRALLDHARQQPAVKVTFTVTVEMTSEQRDGYAEEYGVGFVSLDVKGRVRGDVTEALSTIPWLREFATVALSEPRVKEA